MKKFAFVNEAAEKEYKALPDNIQDEFGKDLRLLQYGEDPRLPITHLSAISTKYHTNKKYGSKYPILVTADSDPACSQLRA